MASPKFRKGQWRSAGSRKPILQVLEPAMPGSLDNKTWVGFGVKPGSTVTVYKDGTSAGTATADSSGNWSYAFASAPAGGAVITWAGVVDSKVSVVPRTPVALGSLTLSASTFAETAAPGTVIGNIVGKTSGSILTISPSDGRVTFNADQSALVVGISASEPGTVNYTISETNALGTNSPKSSVVAVTTTVALQALNARFVAEGDSITAGSNGPTWLWQFINKTRGRFFLPYGYNKATGGETAAAMAGQTATVVGLSPMLVSLLAGTNDLTGSADTPAVIYNNLKTCWKAYIDGGAKHVIAIKVLPRSDATWNALSAARKADRIALNDLIGSFATDPDLAAYKSKIHVVDLESTIVPATDMGDFLHPNWLGAIKLGDGIAAVANTLMQQTATLNDLYLDASNLLVGVGRNPALTGTTGTKSGTTAPTGEVADSWTLTENGAMTIVASKTTQNGAAAQKIVVSGTSNAAGRLVNFQNTAAYSGAAGDQVEACIDFTLAAGHTGLRALSLSCDTALSPSSTAAVVMDGAGALSGTLRTPINTPLAGTDTSTSFQAYLTFAAGAVAADVTFGRPYVRKVPAGQ
jgi:hypothetical protein